MATVYKFEITSHWIAYHPNDMKKMIENALYSCENEITVRNLEHEQANGADTGQDKCHIQNVNGRLTPRVGYIYYIGDYTAPKVFNGLYYECLLTEQRIASHVAIKFDTGVRITDWEHDIYKPERFGLRF